MDPGFTEFSGVLSAAGKIGLNELRFGTFPISFGAHPGLAHKQRFLGVRIVRGNFAQSAEAAGKVMYWLDPIHDARWADLVDRHAEASVFHTTAWLKALHRTYGYRLLVATRSAPEVKLANGIVFCEVKSWISGSRLVSLPFSDHCQPLLESRDDLEFFLSRISTQARQENWRYIEIRPLEAANYDAPNLAVRARRKPAISGWDNRFCRVEQYYYHRIDLRPELRALFSNFHKSCIQRKIERARREGLEYEAGRSESTLRKFYHLLLLTRQRHGLPPQPLVWFQNLIEEFGNDLTIRLACKKGQPVAGILTLLYKKKVVYKYGCSDATLHRTGAMPMLFSRAIQEEKLRGAEELDLGRSDINNPGLSRFKEHLGALQSDLVYFRVGRDTDARFALHPGAAVHAIFSRMPNRLSQAAGRILYKHIG